MYSGDTFFHLSPLGQIGLGLLSGFLAMVTVWIFVKISSRFALIVKVLLAIVLLWLFIWLSPQIYYLYYWLIFDNLPLQWVIQSPPNIMEIWQTITFGGPSNLSSHSKAALFWLMIATAAWRRLKPLREASPKL